jgi:hypothetical protein
MVTITRTKSFLLIGTILLIAVIWWVTRSTEITPPLDETPELAPTEEATSTAATNPITIGSSVEGRAISAYEFGTGETQLLFVGGVHGGYEWNSVVLAEELITFLESDDSSIPTGMKITIIPNLNPDGVHEVLGTTTGFTATDALAIAPTAVAAGRFNANNVDLNRNFDCRWAPTSSWRGATVSAGSAPFSEPEARALRDYVLSTTPDAVVFWHSQANTVYASECENGILPGTLALMNTYASAASYNTVEKFDAYPITGDAEGWLASIGIPAVTVELEGRTTSEWTRNIAGIKATLDLYK